MPDAGSISID